jgi:mRNA interferase RelE/StbE
MYRIRILDAATRDLARLDRPIGRRVAERIRWLAENLDNVRPEPLTADLVGFYKLCVGDYRVVYEILRNEQVIVIHQIDHRRRIYRKR